MCCFYQIKRTFSEDHFVASSIFIAYLYTYFHRGFYALRNNHFGENQISDTFNELVDCKNDLEWEILQSSVSGLYVMACWLLVESGQSRPAI